MDAGLENLAAIQSLNKVQQTQFRFELKILHLAIKPIK